MRDFLNRFFQLSNYNPEKQNINESFYDKKIDVTEWINIGEIGWGNDKYYIFVDPNFKDVHVPDFRFKNEVVRLSKDKNGGISNMTLGELSSFYMNRIDIYPEYINTEYSDIILGERKSEEVLASEHEELFSKLFRVNGKVCLRHDSSVKITDGFIKKGVQNNYSTNYDIGIYFWGSKNIGRDPSNNGNYIYYCLIDENEIYDGYSNPERLSVEKAFERGYKYIADFWRNNKSVLIRANVPTQIWRIFDRHNGKCFDSNWNEVESPF